MNRPIKFRAWDYQEEKMITSYDDLTTGMHGTEPMPLIPLTGGVVIPYWEKSKMDGQSHYELMQFTGLHDKNGVEIYEGDVYEIDFGDGIYRHKVEIPEFYRQINAHHLRRLEVVGNVFENPELLTQTEE